MQEDAPPPRSRPAARPRRSLLAIVLAAGKGTRLPGAGPKPLVECLGEPMLTHVRRAVEGVAPDRVVVLVGHAREAVQSWLARHWPTARAVVQEPQAGTGHAARVALAAVPDFVGDVLVVYGDVPGLTADDLRGLLAAHRGAGAAATVLTGEASEPGRLGRVFRSADGHFERIVEARDATPAELLAHEFNTGIYAFDAAALREAVHVLPTRNAQGEEYLTDALVSLASSGRVACLLSAAASGLLGVNSPEDLARAQDALRRREVARHLAAGVQVLDPATTVIEADVEIAPGARVLPFTYVGHGCRVGPECVVGPFAHLRQGTVLLRGAQVGNFVEVKASTLGEGAKAKHLSYLGDADIGAAANIGCGTITANYDGVSKNRTRVGARARIGSGTVLVAPVSVGDGAVTGANAVVLAGHDVPAGATAVGVPTRVLPKASAGKGPPAGKASRAPGRKEKGRRATGLSKAKGRAR